MSGLLVSENEPIFEIISVSAIEELILNAKENKSKNWYGQLMSAPQTIAYFLQLNHWLKEYNIIIE
jgi:asparagine synthase (glutamine-hydrolysing)